MSSSSSYTSPVISPTTFAIATSASKRRKARKVKYAKALGYLIEPHDIYTKVLKEGKAIEDNVYDPVMEYKVEFAKHRGIYYNDIIAVRNPKRWMPLAYCVVVATNLSKESRIPRTDIIEKAKEFLGTTEEPKWHRIIRA